MKAQRVLVLGGAGFLGSHLCTRLLEDGHEVVALDDLSTGAPSNVDHLLERPRFTFQRHDVLAPFDIPATQVFNLACPASPVHYQADPVRTTLVNVVGTLHGLEVAARHGARFFQASTSEVYGDPEIHPQPETYRGSVSTTGIRACYDEGKRCAESLVMDMKRSCGVDVRIARIFNTYGPRMAIDDGRVVSNFIVQALKGEDLTIFGDGSQTRSFCYVDDLIDGFVRLMNHDEETGPVNLGNPEEFTVAELAETILAMIGGSGSVAYRPLPMDDPRLRRPDISLAQTRLGFLPRIPLQEGLRRTIDHFRSVLDVRLARARRAVPAPRLYGVGSARDA
jgi:UDP-glucuronate decarboxylase